MFLNEMFIHVFNMINFFSTAFIMFALPFSIVNICLRLSNVLWQCCCFFFFAFFFLQNAWVCVLFDILILF